MPEYDAPKLNGSPATGVLRAHFAGCELMFQCFDDRWLAWFSYPTDEGRGSHLFDEGGPAERGSKYDRAKGVELTKRGAREAWRSYLAASFVWQAVRHTSPYPWPEPDEITLDWSSRT